MRDIVNSCVEDEQVELCVLALKRADEVGDALQIASVHNELLELTSTARVLPLQIGDGALAFVSTSRCNHHSHAVRVEETCELLAEAIRTACKIL